MDHLVLHVGDSLTKKKSALYTYIPLYTCHLLKLRRKEQCHYSAWTHKATSVIDVWWVKLRTLNQKTFPFPKFLFTLDNCICRIMIHVWFSCKTSICTKLCITQKREGNDLRVVNTNKGIKSQFRSNSLNQDLCYRVKT